MGGHQRAERRQHRQRVAGQTEQHRAALRQAGAQHGFPGPYRHPVEQYLGVERSQRGRHIVGRAARHAADGDDEIHCRFVCGERAAQPFADHARIITGGAQQERLAAGGMQRGHQVARIRVAHLSRLQGGGKILDQLAAGGQHRHPWPAPYHHLRAAEVGQQQHVRRGDAPPCVQQHVARTMILSPPAHVGARRHRRGHFDCAARFGDLLERQHGVVAVRQQRTGGNANHAGAVGPARRWPLAGRHRADDGKPARRRGAGAAQIAGAYRKAVHRRQIGVGRSLGTD